VVLLDEQPFHSAHSIANAMGVYHSTMLNHLRESLGMKSEIASLALDPAPVKGKYNTRSNGNSRESLAILEAHKESNLENLSLAMRVGDLGNSSFNATRNRCTQVHVDRHLGIRWIWRRRCDD
jgi:hypothetical protein